MLSFNVFHKKANLQTAQPKHQTRNGGSKKYKVTTEVKRRRRRKEKNSGLQDDGNEDNTNIQITFFPHKFSNIIQEIEPMNGIVTT